VECVEVKEGGRKGEGLGKVKQVKGRRVRLGRRWGRETRGGEGDRRAREAREEREVIRAGNVERIERRHTGESVGSAMNVEGRMEKYTRSMNLGRERSDSVGEGVLDGGKRKREMLGKESPEEGRVAEIFKRSHKTSRSPGGGKEGQEVREMLKEMRNEINKGLEGVRKEIKREAEGQKEVMRMEVEKMKEELRAREERWNKEREELKRRIERVEQEIEGLRIGRKEGEKSDEEAAGGKGRGRSGGREVDEWKEKVKQLERRWEMKERGDRRRNLIVKGMKGGEGSMKERVEEIIKGLGVRVEGKVEEVRRIDGGKREKGDMVIVKMATKEAKREVMVNKWRLKGKEIWIEEDLTWEERRISWRARRVALERGVKGNSVRIGQGGAWIGGEWWTWDEEREELRLGRRERTDIVEERNEQGEGKGERGRKGGGERKEESV